MVNNTTNITIHSQSSKEINYRKNDLQIDNNSDIFMLYEFNNFDIAKESATVNAFYVDSDTHTLFVDPDYIKNDIRRYLKENKGLRTIIPKIEARLLTIVLRQLLIILLMSDYLV